MSKTVPLDLTREEISSILSSCDSSALQSLIDSLLSDGSISLPEVVRPPVTGTVQLQVREPICEERFIVGDALVTVAEVSVDGLIGWAMRLGDDANGAVAAAIADAHIARVGLGASPAIAELIALTKAELEQSDRTEWAEIEGTVIEFEELD
jgi:alpha-D-ribose 1-methylphosphonate 5-triphosphate synthase subunit PhnG